MGRPTGPVYCRGMAGEDGTPAKPPQGWFVDPFGVHEARWFSQGRPTALVRDGGVESQDPAPGPAVDQPLVRARPAPPSARVPPPPVDVGRAAAADGPGPGSGVGRSDPGSPPVDVTPSPVPADGGHPVSSIPLNAPPPTPARSLRGRWFTFGFACVWTALVTGLLFTTTTATRVGTGPGAHDVNRTPYASDRVGVLLFVAALVAACVLTGIGLLRRIRRGSEASSRTGYVCGGILALLGVLSLASAGLALIILGAALALVSRPIRQPRPLPGERLV